MTFELAAIARSSIVLAIGLLLLAGLRRQPAAFRHAILAAALMLAAAQPGATLIMPSWAMPTIWNRAAAEIIPEAARSVETTTVFEVIGAAPDTTSSLQPAVIVTWIWIAGVIISVGGMAGAVSWLIWLGHRGREADGAWNTIARELSAALGIRRPIRVLITRHPAVLATWGAIRPVILLPSDAASWPADRVRVVLAHELAHVARRDWLVHVIAELARSVYWFNPLFWYACARLRRDSEHACDDLVLANGIGRTCYAAHLVALARAFRLHGRTWLPAPSMARPSTLERRIRTMLNPPNQPRPLSAAARVAIVAALSCAALQIAAASQAPATPSGTVMDSTGRVVPGVTVRLSSSTSEVFETQTDASGAYQFAAVPSGDYMLSTRYLGFQSLRRRVSISASTPAMPLTIQVGTLQETITTRGNKDSKDGPRTEERKQPYARAACTPQETGGHIEPPQKIRDVRPRYKQAWAEANRAGLILLQAVIGVDGRVRELEVVSPVDPELEDEALEAVSQWEFTPTWLNCQAIEVRMFVTVSFAADR
jgi:beta-lactamase regulating signal transducer with metallopeptidase domain